jgi:Trp operon repressor
MSVEDYLSALDSRLREIAALIVASNVQREIDANTGIGFQKGSVTFVDGSRKV